MANTLANDRAGMVSAMKSSYYTVSCQGRPGTPFWKLDFPILNYRIPMWTSWGPDITGLLYWSTTKGFYQGRPDQPANIRGPNTTWKARCCIQGWTWVFGASSRRTD